jgi:hypothetical protein
LFSAEKQGFWTRGERIRTFDLLLPTVKVCSILFSLKKFGKYMFLGEKLMFILADFRKNNPCGDSLETGIYRKY